MNNAPHLLFDVEFAKEQTLHNDSLLLELLEQFLSDNQQICEDIRDKANESPEALHFVLHRLKGAASNLGCMQLFKLLQVHCQTLSNGTLIASAEITEVTNLIEETFASMSTYLAAQQSEQQPYSQHYKSSIEDPVKFLKTLKGNVEDNAFISSEELNQLSALGETPESKKLIEQLIASIEHLEYEEATNITAQLLLLDIFQSH